MRVVILAAGVCGVALGLSACGPSKTETAAPAAPKYVGRSQQMYQGQELVQKVDAGTVAPGKDGKSLEMTATGSVPMAGYKNAGFLKRIFAFPPKDGIYEMDVVADKPASGAAVVTPIEVKGAWDNYPADRVKGVRFIAKDNSVVAMLPGK